MSTKIPSTLELFRSGLRARMAAHDAEERAKAGTFRGGSTGVYLQDGRVAGHCHRLAALRFLGIDPPMTAKESEEWERRQLMFEAGHSNEDSWHAVLSASPLMQEHGLEIRREAEFPAHWQLEHGDARVDVTGRPDFVIGRSEDGRFVPVRGLELKLAASGYKAIDVLFAGEPDFKHLAQAAHYMMALGLPEYELWYTSRVDFHVMQFFKKTRDGKWEVRQDDVLPQPGDVLARFVEFSPPKKGERGPRKVKKIQPFTAGYELRWAADGDTLQLRSLTRMDLGLDAEWLDTAITKSGIVDFFRYTADTVARRDLGQRVATVKWDGTPHRYSQCDYCDLRRQCIDYEKKGFDAWVEAVKGRADAPSSEESAETEAGPEESGHTTSGNSTGARKSSSSATGQVARGNRRSTSTGTWGKRRGR